MVSYPEVQLVTCSIFPLSKFFRFALNSRLSDSTLVASENMMYLLAKNCNFQFFNVRVQNLLSLASKFKIRSSVRLADC